MSSIKSVILLEWSLYELAGICIMTVPVTRDSTVPIV